MKRVRPVAMLPTMVTLGNVFSGFLAIAYLTDSLAVDPTGAEAAAQRMVLYERSILLIFLAMVFDALDGFVARLTKQATAFGAQVDSMCDVVSFGAAPALLFKVMAESPPGVATPKLALVLAVIFLACGVLRLARFNLEAGPEEESHHYFEGLPIPAAAAAVAAMAHANLQIDPEAGNSWMRTIMPYCMPILAGLMVSRVPYLHVGTFLARRRDFSSLVSLVFLLGLGVLYHEIALPVICLGYVATGPVLWLVRRGRKPAPAVEDPDLEA